MEPGRSENVGRASLHLEARQEGILLDPANASKAMAALAADIKQGRLRRTEPVLFGTQEARPCFGYTPSSLYNYTAKMECHWRYSDVSNRKSYVDLAN